MIQSPKHKQKILVAIDSGHIEKAKTIAHELSNLVGGVKVGLEFFNKNGNLGINQLLEKINGEKFLFLDLKFHDIPNTVEGAIRSVINENVNMLNVHASGGFEMMRAAKRQVSICASEQNIAKPLLIAVTILTSLNHNDLSAIGYGKASIAVVKMALLAKKAGLDGVVCSPLEIKLIREACGDDFILVVPGIRLNGSDKDDQQRTKTPRFAIESGADFIVIGREITNAPDMKIAVSNILATLQDI